MANLYLYRVTNILDSKQYYGISLNPKKRFYSHKSKSSTCTKLKNAIQKHGIDNFKLEILCYGEESYIKDLEVKCIEYFDTIENGYNIILGNPRDGNFFMSSETKERLSLSLLQYNRDNVNHNLGRRHKSRVNDEPIYILGFWFPNHRTALKALDINKKSLYRWVKLGNAGDEVRPQTKSKVYNPCYISGMWFPDMLTASSSLKISIRLIQERIKNGNIEAKDKRAKTIYSEV